MIKLHNLTKKYNDFTAVSDLNLTIETGEFFGLLGQNGAGKTTTMNMLSTVLLPTDGYIEIDGEKLSRGADALKRKISIVTQEYSMRQDMTVEQVMEYQGRLYHLPVKSIRERSDELLKLTGLLEFAKRRVRNLSGGMKRRLMIARALLTEPEILLLDEPTAGMDALLRRQIWELLRELQKKQLTIILTTHYMEEAQELCDRVAFINKGKLDIVAAPEMLIKNLGEYCVAGRFFRDRDKALEYLSGNDEVNVLRQTTLEDVFVEFYGNNDSSMGKVDRV